MKFEFFDCCSLIFVIKSYGSSKNWIFVRGVVAEPVCCDLVLFMVGVELDFKLFSSIKLDFCCVGCRATCYY